MEKSKEEIIEYITTLKGYQGYVQFSHRPIDKEKDIFYNNKEVKVEDENGFIYEAHFYNGKNSITIKQVNNHWLVDEIENTPLDDTQIYLSDIKEFNYNIKMAQIWDEVEDILCQLEKDTSGKTIKGMKVKKLQKVVFVGFEKGESK